MIKRSVGSQRIIRRATSASVLRRRGTKEIHAPATRLRVPTNREAKFS